MDGGEAERRLLNTLMEQYNKLERPVYNESQAVQLKFGLTLQQIIDVVSTECSYYCQSWGGQLQSYKHRTNYYGSHVMCPNLDIEIVKVHQYDDFLLLGRKESNSYDQYLAQLGKCSSLECCAVPCCAVCVVQCECEHIMVA